MAKYSSVLFCFSFLEQENVALVLGPVFIRLCYDAFTNSQLTESYFKMVDGKTISDQAGRWKLGVPPTET